LSCKLCAVAAAAANGNSNLGQVILDLELLWHKTSEEAFPATFARATINFLCPKIPQKSSKQDEAKEKSYLCSPWL